MKNKLIKDFAEFIGINKSGTQIKEQEEFNFKNRIYTGNTDIDDNSRFLINNKIVQGIKSTNKEMEDFIKKSLSRGYGKDIK